MFIRPSTRNVRRRHLSVGQQAAVAASLVRYYRSKYPKTGGADLEKVAQDLGLPKVGENSPASDDQTRDLVAKAMNVAPDAVKNFETIRKQAPELAQQVASGQKPLYAADAERKAGADLPASSSVGLLTGPRESFLGFSPARELAVVDGLTRRQTKAEAAKEGCDVAESAAFTKSRALSD